MVTRWLVVACCLFVIFSSTLLFSVIFSLVRGLTSAKQIVDFCKEKPMFRQVIQKKYLNATTTRRSYYHLTSAKVDDLTPEALLRARAVKP